MKIDAIEEALQARPFVAFDIVLPSDRAVPVLHPDFVSIAPNRKSFIVWNSRSGMSWIEPAMIVQLSFNGAHQD